MSISKQGWLIKKLFRYLITNPINAIRMIDLRNIKILYKAIRTESPRQIFNNFLKRVAHKEEIQKTIESKGIRLRCTISRVYDYKIHLDGWCLGATEIKEIMVFIKNKRIGKVDYGLESVDVAKAFPNNKYSKTAQFRGVFYGAFNPKDPITLVAKDIDGNIEKLILEKFTNTEQQDYDQFIEHASFTPNKKKKLLHKIAATPPVGLTAVTILTEKSIKDCQAFVKSIQEQYYKYWEMLIYVSPNTKQVFAELIVSLAKDERIKFFSDKQLNAPAAINRLISEKKYNHVVHLNAASVLAPTAFYEISKLANEKEAFGIIYTDEDIINDTLQRSKPHFKPDFNHDLLLSHNYIGDTITICNLNKNDIKIFDEQFEYSYTYHFVLMNMMKHEISHISKVLVHKRNFEINSSIRSENKKAITQYLKYNNIDVEVESGIVPETFNIKRAIVEEQKVSIIIPFKDEVDLLKSCLKSIKEKTNYINYEIILVSNNSELPTTFDFLKELKDNKHIHCYEYDIPFNYSKINNWAVQKAKGDYILFLNNDVEVISTGWLTTMVSQIQRKEVGAVGAKLLYFDNSVQHAGVVIGIGGLADHVFKSFPDTHNGYFGRANLVQNLSACTAACLMVKKSDFNLVNGFDEENLAIEFNDVDLCLKLKINNKLIVFDPNVKLYHYESKSRGKLLMAKESNRSKKESTYFISKWKNLINEGDPFYNKNLSLIYADYSPKV